MVVIFIVIIMYYIASLDLMQCYETYAVMVISQRQWNYRTVNDCRHSLYLPCTLWHLFETGRRSSAAERPTSESQLQTPQWNFIFVLTTVFIIHKDARDLKMLVDISSYEMLLVLLPEFFRTCICQASSHCLGLQVVVISRYRYITCWV